MPIPLFKNGSLLFCTNPSTGVHGLAETCCPEIEWQITAVAAGTISGTSPACTVETFTDLPAVGTRYRYGTDYAQSTAIAACTTAIGNAAVTTTCTFWCYVGPGPRTDPAAWQEMACGTNKFADNLNPTVLDYNGGASGAEITMRFEMNDCGGRCDSTKNKYLEITIAAGTPPPRNP